MSSRFIFLAISVVLDLSSLNYILFCLAQFSIFARSELVYASASDVVSLYVSIARSSAKATTFVWLVNSRFKRAFYRTFQNSCCNRNLRGSLL